MKFCIVCNEMEGKDIVAIYIIKRIYIVEWITCHFNSPMLLRKEDCWLHKAKIKYWISDRWELYTYNHIRSDCKCRIVTLLCDILWFYIVCESLILNNNNNILKYVIGLWWVILLDTTTFSSECQSLYRA
jgi:hypothetical protein